MNLDWAYGILGIIMMAFCLVGVTIFLIARTILIINKNKVKISERAVK